tara:strand:- start:103 stop:540 length:438 start_codon:yes stop_codon:yes gene_type:complete
LSSIAKVERIVSVPKQYFWARLLNFGDIKSFLPENIDNVDCDGNEIGSLRHITLGEITGYPGEVVERLEGIYGDSFFVYSVVDKSCLPFTNYVSCVSVREVSSSECEVCWHSHWKADGLEEKEVKTMLEGFYELIFSNAEKQFLN